MKARIDEYLAIDSDKRGFEVDHVFNGYIPLWVNSCFLWNIWEATICYGSIDLLPLKHAFQFSLDLKGTGIDVEVDDLRIEGDGIDLMISMPGSSENSVSCDFLTMNGIRVVIFGKLCPELSTRSQVAIERYFTLHRKNGKRHCVPIAERLDMDLSLCH